MTLKTVFIDAWGILRDFKAPRIGSILIDCLKTETPESFRLAFRKLSGITEQSEWDAMQGAHQSRALTPFYIAAAAIRETSFVPLQTQRDLSAQLLYIERRNEKILRSVVEIATRFNEQKMDFILLKGPALLLSVYKDRSAVRRIGDIDILVREKEIARAEEILRQAGYAEDYSKLSAIYGKVISKDYFRECHYHYSYYKGDLGVELHWDIVYGSDRALVERLFDLTEFKIVDGARVKVLNGAATLFMACFSYCQGFQHSFFVDGASMGSRQDGLFHAALFSIFEISQILRHYGDGISWDDFLELAKKDRNSYSVLLPLEMTIKAIGLPIPKKVLQAGNANIFIGSCIYFSGLCGAYQLSVLFLIQKVFFRLQRYAFLLGHPRFTWTKFGRQIKHWKRGRKDVS